MGEPGVDLAGVRGVQGEAALDDVVARTPGLRHRLPPRSELELCTRPGERVDRCAVGPLWRNNTGRPRSCRDDLRFAVEPPCSDAAVALELGPAVVTGPADRHAHRDRHVVGHDERLEQRDRSESQCLVAGGEGQRSEVQLEMPGARKQGDARRCAVLVDEPVMTGRQRADQTHGAVALREPLGEDRMGHRVAGLDPEAGAMSGGGGDAHLAPQAVVDGDHPQVAVLAGQRVEDAVGGDVGRLAVGHEHGRGRRDEHEQLGAAAAQLVDEGEAAPSLGTDDHFVVLVRGQLDRSVAQLAGGVDRTVEPAELALRALDSRPDRLRVGEVGGHDRDLRAERLELDEAADAPARRVVVAVTGQPLAPLDAFGHGAAGHDDDVRFVVGDEVTGEREPDAAEAARHEVVAAGPERDGVGRHRTDAEPFRRRHEPAKSSAGDDLVGCAEQFAHDGGCVGRRRAIRVEIDERGPQVDVLAWCGPDDADRHRIGGGGRGAGHVGGAAGDRGEQRRRSLDITQRTARCRRRGQPAVDGGVEAARRSDQHDRSRRRQEGGVRRGRHLDQVATRRQVARQRGDERVGGVTDDDPRSDRRRCGSQRLAFDPRGRPELVGQLGDPGRFPRGGCRDGGRCGDGSHRGDGRERRC